ncbi:family 20 glycosylhydrolase [Roseateles toxinivorans]|uniref:beta-N-acetylhexosaminidase n=1 Tax=Roseateles toxinivorans TaxID=270368 RepID=A0A4R6QQI4_9BURK|nr:family 20 glycosylhydrolase [Roseateles toxinivorans]TDP73276.1 hexosaminidase [Roseateles toxinivorans]
MLPLMPWPRELTCLGGHLPGATVPALPGTRSALSAWPGLPGLRLLLDRPDDGAPPPPAMDEGYRLAVRPDGIVLQAATVFGALRGLQTLAQLLGASTDLPCVEIEDAPRFPWRGLLIDSARRHLPLPVLKRQLDGMAAAKLNVLHWHLTDDQGWRLASDRYPQLQAKASGGAFYTLDEARELVAYAGERGIRVVPELDVPGHATALGAAYPELMSAPGPAAPERGFGVFKPCLDPRKPEVAEFLEHLVGEWAQAFPDPYFHIGGDEVEPSHWLALGLEPARAQADFNQAMAALLARHGKRMVGWDEIAGPDLPKHVLVQSWRGPDSLADAARAGYEVLLSAGFYLDQPQTSAFHWRRPVLPPVAMLPIREMQQHWRLDVHLRVQCLRAELGLAQAADGTWQGWIAFDGQARQLLADVHWRGAEMPELHFALDTWMGETAARLRLDGGELQGIVRIANVRYPAVGEAINAEQLARPRLPATLAAPAAQRVLGGEAALWSELVDEHCIDLRLWPRGFAVAERFWSDPVPADEADFYQRLDATSDWAARSIGLAHHAQHEQALLRLAGASNLAALKIFCEVLEPGGYYARQHEKKAAGRYHLDEPLDRLADGLPAENRAMQRLAAVPLDAAGLAQWRAQLLCWQAELPAVQTLLPTQPRLAALRPLAPHWQGLCVLGVELLLVIEQGRVLPYARRAAAQAQIDAAAAMVDEVVLALVAPLERLLDACR